jgi:hypothetical protein
MTDDPTPCGIRCATEAGDALNRSCACRTVDVAHLRESLEASLRGTRVIDPLVHAHLFSPYALVVDRAALEAMGGIATAVFKVAGNPQYIEHVLGWAPPIARHDPGSVGGVLGLDFHLTVDGPRLIEINTNPGGLLLNALLMDVVQSCAPAAWAPWTGSAFAREASVSAWLDDASRQQGRMPARCAIVDVAPSGQFLYPEFELYAQAFRERGVESVILPPEALTLGADGLRDAEGRIDAVYNRLTDFALADPAHAALRDAYRGHAVALTPHPRAHALFADKRNLATLGDASLLEGWGIDAASVRQLARVIPPTVALTPANRDALWAVRDRHFFKPAHGFGSRGSYRGDKLTRRVWDTLASGPYVAQAIAPPAARVVQEGVSLKADVRCFASASGILLFAARLYQGQTTNMRTPGGGFAAVLTTPAVPTA